MEEALNALDSALSGLQGSSSDDQSVATFSSNLAANTISLALEDEATSIADLDLTGIFEGTEIPLNTQTDFDGDSTNEVNVEEALNALSNAEPWFIEGSTNRANKNDDEIFIMGDWVGIGVNSRSSSPATNETLFVNGTIRTANSIYADYVLEHYVDGSSSIKPDYEFKSLSEVEAFIIKNKHLPGVTGIKNIEKTENGYHYDLTNLSIESLEKIEELYLHAIEQQKTINQLLTRVLALESLLK